MIGWLSVAFLSAAMAAEPAGEARVVFTSPKGDYEIFVKIDRNAERDSTVVPLYDGLARRLCVAPCEAILPAGHVDLFGRKIGLSAAQDTRGAIQRGFRGQLPRGTTHFEVRPGAPPVANAGIISLAGGASVFGVGAIFAAAGALVGPDDELGRDFILGGLVTMGVGAAFSLAGIIAFEAARARWKRTGPRAQRRR